MPTDLAEPALALFLLRQARRRGRLVAILRGAGRLDRVGRLAAILADDVEVIVLPPPDVLPYDLVRPSPQIVGRRVKALSELSREPAGPRLLLTSAAGALQRVRPAVVWREAALTLRAGQTLDLAELRTALAERGYHWDERIDEPGEVALRGQVIDVFPAGDPAPARLMLDGARIDAINAVDPVTLRTTAPLDAIELRPATEYRIEAGDDAQALLEPGDDLARPELEQHLPRRLVPIFALMPQAATYCDGEVAERWQSARDGIDDAYEAARKAGRLTGAADLPPPDRLFLSVAEATAACANPVVPGKTAGKAGSPVEPPPRIEALIQAARSADGARVLITTPSHADAVCASLKKRGLDVAVVQRLAELKRGEVGVLEAELPVGLEAPGLLLLPVGALLRPKQSAALATGAESPRIGEIVVHLDHGVCRLTGLREVGEEDRIALEFADGVELLIPPDELDRVWRYGDSGGSLDRLGSEGWGRKREEIEAELQRTAEALEARAAARAASVAPVLRPPTDRFNLVARRFPYPLSPDQRAAIHAVLADLASGHRMDRLLCGDVGFGKTEVALRAAAAAALAGTQVAIAAPTTVLARQHLDTFRTRFEGTGIRVEGLMRAGPETREVRRAVAAGEVGIVVGTHALAGARFRELGLVVIDEEQRFGEGDKSALAGLAPHVLAMTATPIPRTMQEALVGLRDVSLLATPPQRRQPSRTFVLPWDPIVVREALLRENRRGGQSFCVCPRIADLDRVAAELAELVPELALVTAHGRMRPEALEAAVLGFAAGRGDVLVATNIIEAGLDIPNANLMLVTKADRFGLAQLHQLRGRVGRGARRGAAYFLTEPGRRLTEATQRRLLTMQALTALGAGVAVSAADLDLRGAGDLFGERQSGHVRAVGTELYQHLLLQALARRRGDAPPPPAPALHVELAGGIPADYVPEPNLRIELLQRLSRIVEIAELRRFALELEDRFGEVPPSTARLLTLQRLRILGRTHELLRIDAGSRACAITPSAPRRSDALADALGGTVKDGRVLLPLAAADALGRAEALADALGAC